MRSAATTPMPAAIDDPATAAHTRPAFLRIARLAAAISDPRGRGAAFVALHGPDTPVADEPATYRIVASVGVGRRAHDALPRVASAGTAPAIAQTVAAAAAQAFGWRDAVGVPVRDASGALAGALVVRATVTGAPAVRARLADLAAIATDELALAGGIARARQLRPDWVRLRALAEYGTDLFALVDADGCVRYASPAALRALGHAEDPAAVLDRPVLDLVHPADLPRAAALFAAVRGEPGARRRARLRIERPAGEVCTFDVVAEHRLGDPELAAVVVSARDVTRVAALEAQLCRVQEIEAAGQARHGLAHDVTNALAVIGTSARLAREALAEVAPDATRRRPIDEDLDEIEAEVRRAAALARQLVDAGRARR